MVNLDEFLAQSLVQIVEGIRSAQSQVNTTGGEIVPSMPSSGSGSFGWSDSGLSVMLIDFDVAVTATEEKGSKAGIAVLGPILGAGGQVQTDVTSSSVSRIRFQVPVAYPQQGR